MLKLLGYLISIIIIIFIVMFVAAIALWILNLSLFIIKWIALVAIFGFIILSIINFIKSRKGIKVRHFSHFLYLSLASVLIFGIAGYLQPKLHTYLNSEEIADDTQTAEEEEIVEVTKIVNKEVSAEEKAVEEKKEEAELKLIVEKEAKQKEEEERKKAESEANRKAEEEAKLLAEAEARKPISTNFASFDNPYDQMTDLQKDKFWEDVNGKYVEWTGKVVEVTEESISIKCEPDTLIDDFIAEITEKQRESMLNINIGDTITIYGKLSSKEGVLLSWYLDEGEIK